MKVRPPVLPRISSELAASVTAEPTAGVPQTGAPGFSEPLSDEVRRLRVLVEVADTVTRQLSLDHQLPRFIDLITEALDAERATLFLHDPDTGELLSRVLRGEGVAEIRTPANAGIAGAVFGAGTAEIIADAYQDRRFNPEIDRQTGYRTRNILCVPLRNRDGQVIGVTQALNKRSGDFAEADLALAEAINRHAASALEQAFLVEKADGSLVSNDFARIADDWLRSKDKRTIWNNVKLSNPYYLVPRYYDQRLSDEVAQDAHRLNSPVTTLGDLVKAGFISIRKGHEVGSDAYGSGDVPFVRTSDIHNFEVSHDPTNCVSEEIYEQFRWQQKLKPGDLLIVVDGRYKIGRCAILHEWTKRCVVQSHLRIVSLAPKAKFPPISLLYGLALPSVQREIRRLVFIQSTLGGLGPRIGEIRLPDPRAFASWGEAFQRFGEAVKARAEHAAYLQSYGHEIEL